MERFVELHPGWRLVLWGDVEAEALLVEICASQPKLRPLQTIFSYLTNPGIKSDIVRYFVLLQQGGLYFDVDYEFVRDVDTLLAQSQAGFLCGLSNTIHPEEVNNGILAAVPQHPFVRFLLEQMMSSLSKVMPNPLQLAFMTKPEVQNFLQALHGK